MELLNALYINELQGIFYFDIHKHIHFLPYPKLDIEKKY